MVSEVGGGASDAHDNGAKTNFLLDFAQAGFLPGLPGLPLALRQGPFNSWSSIRFRRFTARRNCSRNG
jgi:hypothetical protein